MSKEFKAGDKVYYPLRSTKVLTIGEQNCPRYPIMAGGHVFTRDGKFLGAESLPSIYHATPEMKAKLEDLHGVEFEAPPAVPTSKDIIATMLERGDKLQNYQMENTMSKEFKAGDLVYCPQKGHGIFTVQSSRKNLRYPIKILRDDGCEAFFTTDGRLYITDKEPTIYHATPETKRLLEQLHGIKLEDAPVKPTSREIIQAKLNKSTKPVPCWVNNDPNCTQPTRKDVWAFIQEVDTEDPSSEFPFLAATGNWWMHATPFDPRTDEAITELPE